MLTHLESATGRLGCSHVAWNCSPVWGSASWTVLTLAGTMRVTWLCFRYFFSSNRLIGACSHASLGLQLAYDHLCLFQFGYCKSQKQPFFFFQEVIKQTPPLLRNRLQSHVVRSVKIEKKKRLCSIETNWEGTQCLPPRSHARLTPHIPRSATPDCSLTGPEPAPYYALIGAGNLRAGPDHTLANWMYRSFILSWSSELYRSAYNKHSQVFSAHNMDSFCNENCEYMGGGVSGITRLNSSFWLVNNPFFLAFPCHTFVSRNYIKRLQCPLASSWDY